MLDLKLLISAAAPSIRLGCVRDLISLGSPSLSCKFPSPAQIVLGTSILQPALNEDFATSAPSSVAHRLESEGSRNTFFANIAIVSPSSLITIARALLFLESGFSLNSHSPLTSTPEFG